MSTQATTEAYESKRGCVHCGNNPVNHTVMWVTQSLATLLIPASQVLLLFDLPVMKIIVRAVLIPYLYLFGVLRIVRFSNDETGAETERSRVIFDEAKRRGLSMEQLVLFGKPVEQYRVKQKNSWYYFTSLPIPPWIRARSYAWMDDKDLLKRHFRKVGVPVPEGGRARTLRNAEAIFDRVLKPVIVKPVTGSRGRHSTTNLHTKDDLRTGFDIGKQLCAFVVVEEHLVGSVYRGTYVGGEIVGILRGDPARVTGDGNSTIATLIERKNATRHERVREYVVTDLTHTFLARQGLVVGSVLPEGVTVDLSEKVGLSYGGYTAEETPIAHPKIFAHLKRAGDSLDAPAIGFDFIIEDVTKDPDTQRWGIIEANSLPFINLHHFPVEGTPVNVAAKVWDLWEHPSSRKT